MKRLLLIWIFSGSLDGIAQDKIDTIRIGGLKLIFRNDTLFNQFVTGEVVSTRDGRTDTLRSILLVTGKPPAFTHAVYGYCVVRNGEHVGHLDSRGRLFKLPVRVWGCDNYQNRKR
jgi:hypothetical protein